MKYLHPFDRLILSTRAFHDRFGTSQSTYEILLKVMEEVGEVIEECFRPDGLVNRDSLARESVDVMVTLIGLCNAAGISSDDLYNVMHQIASKNDAKIPGKTHDINPDTGKIERIKNGLS